MKRFWVEIWDWIVTPYLPVERSRVELESQWRARCEKAERAPTWEREFLHEARCHKGTQRQLGQAMAELEALKGGMTASGLSPAEVERLALLAMAAGKLAADAAKVVLYGWSSPAPHDGRPAYTDVEHGMGRLAAIVELMKDVGDVRRADVHEHKGRAKQRIGEQATRQPAAASRTKFNATATERATRKDAR